LDATLLLLPAVGFLPVSDPRMEQTIAAIERRLMRDGFVIRYDTAVGDDGLPPARALFWPAVFGWPMFMCCRVAWPMPSACSAA